MQRKTITLDETLQIAAAACRHARNQIRKGSTQIENNSLSEVYTEFLDVGVIEIRDLIRQEMLDSRFSKSFAENRTLAHFESTIAVTSKFSLGNCFELSLQALDYILTHEKSDISAEAYNIEGGDHSFLVLNRDPSSDPLDPKTWGDSAVICDPWSNQSYPASDYLSQLKNFNYRDGKNSVESFNIYRHTLAQEENFNTTFLRQSRSIQRLKDNFASESHQLITTMQYYAMILIKEYKPIRMIYGVNDPQALILRHKINDILAIIKKATASVEHYITADYQNDYRTAKTNLRTELRELYKSAFASMQFSNKDRMILFEPRENDNEVKAQFAKFFGIKQKKAATLKDAIETASTLIVRKGRK